MDPEDQRVIQAVTLERGAENLLVLLGTADPDSAEITALTVTQGDPTYVGPLAGVPLGLPVYHILEPEIKRLIPPEVYDAQVGMMELVLDVPRIEAVMRQVRETANS
jgi:glycine reductase